jgi:hypothetical protein
VGMVQITLYGPDQTTPLWSRAVPAAEIIADQPFVLTLAPQNDAYQQPFILEVAAGSDSGLHGLTLWRYWAPKHRGARLEQEGKPLRGQLAFQCFFGAADAELLPPRQGPGAWGKAPQPVNVMLQHAAQQAKPLLGETRRLAQQAGPQLSEARRLTQQTYHVIQQKGIAGFLDEVGAYVRWKLGSGRPKR